MTSLCDAQSDPGVTAGWRAGQQRVGSAHSSDAGRRDASPASLSVDYLSRQPGREPRNEINDQLVTCDELMSLSELVDFGSQNLSQPNLTRIDVLPLRKELTASHHKLAEMIGHTCWYSRFRTANMTTAWSALAGNPV